MNLHDMGFGLIEKNGYRALCSRCFISLENNDCSSKKDFEKELLGHGYKKIKGKWICDDCWNIYFA